MSTTIEGTQVRLERDPENLRKFRIMVQVYSQKRPGLKATQEIDPGACRNKDHLLQLVGVAGAACAEYLGEKYGDNIDPADCSKNALHAFGEEARLMAALAVDVPAKMRRLESHVARLTNEQQEVLLRLRHLLDKQCRLVPREIRWLDERLGEIHGSQL